MKLKYRRVSAAVLALVVCLSVAPAGSARANHDRERYRDRDRVEPREQVIRIVKRIKNLLGRMSAEDDYPQPPRP
jgi:hypothetical protein